MDRSNFLMFFLLFSVFFGAFLLILFVSALGEVIIMSIMKMKNLFSKIAVFRKQ